MIFDQKKKFKDIIEIQIKNIPHELRSDAVGLWQIVSAGNEQFNLRGESLVAFTGRCILELLKYGAMPVRGGKGTIYDWILQPQYGDSNDEIADSVISEWLLAGSGEPDVASLRDFENPANPGGVWFALPTGARYTVGKSLEIPRGESTIPPAGDRG